MFTSNILSSVSLRKLSEKLTKCLSVVCGDDSACNCECKTNKEVRELIIRMAGFVSGYDWWYDCYRSVYAVCDEDIFSEETAAAHKQLCTRFLEFEYTFFSTLDRSQLDEKECLFMMEVLGVENELRQFMYSSIFVTRQIAKIP